MYDKGVFRKVSESVQTSDLQNMRKNLMQDVNRNPAVFAESKQVFTNTQRKDNNVLKSSSGKIIAKPVRGEENKSFSIEEDDAQKELLAAENLLSEVKIFPDDLV